MKFNGKGFFATKMSLPGRNCNLYPWRCRTKENGIEGIKAKHEILTNKFLNLLCLVARAWHRLTFISPQSPWWGGGGGRMGICTQNRSLGIFCKRFKAFYQNKCTTWPSEFCLWLAVTNVHFMPSRARWRRGALVQFISSMASHYVFFSWPQEELNIILYLFCVFFYFSV